MAGGCVVISSMSTSISIVGGGGGIFPFFAMELSSLHAVFVGGGQGFFPGAMPFPSLRRLVSPFSNRTSDLRILFCRFRLSTSFSPSRSGTMGVAAMFVAARAVSAAWR